ncbi:hypothetical protein ABLB03_23495 [Vibrio parahaemolyticus]
MDNQLDNKEDKKVNYFVRSLITITSLAISVMAFLSFFLAEPKYQISAGIITLIAMVIVIILSESFNNLSIGKILTLSNEVRKNEKENEKVKNENKELRQELFKFVANVQQSQINNTYNAPSDEWLKALGVIKSDDVSDAEDEHEEQQELQEQVEARRIAQREKSRERRERLKKAEKLALNKYLEQLSIPQGELIERVEFSNAFDEIDPIMNRRIVFDGYLKQPHNERFIEVIFSTSSTITNVDRLYVMLNKIHFYREAKKINSDLLLIIINLEEQEEEMRRRDITERLFDYFQPAIRNKLLKIEHIQITKEDIDKFEANGQQSLF